MATTEQYRAAELSLTTRRSRQAFGVHARVFAIFAVGITALNLVLIATTSADFVWFPFSVLGWGIGLTSHYLFGVRWIDREVRARQDDVLREVASAGATPALPQTVRRS